MRESSYTLTVRGYELDSFGHVNNAVYLNYFEHGRWKLFYETGIYDYFAGARFFAVVTSVNMKFAHELRLFDEVVVKTEMFPDGNFIISKQRISMVNDNKKIATANMKLLLVDENRIPQELPDVFFKNL